MIRADRATEIGLAQIFALPGAATIHDLRDLLAAVRGRPAVRSVIAERAPRGDARDGDIPLERGDLRARLVGLAAGETTLCVIPLSTDIIDPAGLRKIMAHAADVEVRCRTVSLAAGGPRPAFLFVVPPMKRLP